MILQPLANKNPPQQTSTSSVSSLDSIFKTNRRPTLHHEDPLPPPSPNKEFETLEDEDDLLDDDDSYEDEEDDQTNAGHSNNHNDVLADKMTNHHWVSILFFSN
jgi:hypothetical protein